MQAGARAYLRFDWRMPDKFHCVRFNVTRLDLRSANLSASAQGIVPLLTVKHIEPWLFVIERILGCCHRFVRSPKSI
jgi:hypothetical protein